MEYAATGEASHATALVERMPLGQALVASGAVAGRVSKYHYWLREAVDAWKASPSYKPRSSPS
jgi:hypothetical protein